MQLNPQQSEALKAIEHFIESKDISVFQLKGYAGTGKTTLLIEILKMAAQKGITCQVMAPTGRAAKVIRDKTGADATTIHVGIYSFDNVQELEDEKGFRLLFPLKINDGEHPLCIIDEASMISSMISKHEIYQCGTGVLLNDLLTYAAPNSGGKIIFIGDPAQLPPVGDANSMAFNTEYLNSLGLKVESYELTQVMRQGNNAILRNASMIREKLHNQLFSQLGFELQDNEVEIVPDITSEFCSRYDTNSSINPVVITYSNKQAANYNRSIREILFPNSTTICANDVLMCVRNNYTYGEPIYNGDFLKVLKVHPGEIKKVVQVYVDLKGKRVKVPVELTFQSVTIQTSNSEILTCYIITTLLNNNEPSLDISKINALFVDFKIRHLELKVGTEEFKQALRTDPFFNALQVKYGYAITGHKSQGGEWNDVFVDFTGQLGNCAQSLRWIYTVTTRAKKHLYSMRFPELSLFHKLHLPDITHTSQFPDNFFPTATTPSQENLPIQQKTPFHDEQVPDFIRQKFFQISQDLQEAGCSVVNVSSHNYLEKYTIQTPSGKYLYFGDYKKNKSFKFRSNPDCPENDTLLPLLNATGTQAEPQPTEFEYEASSPVLEGLHTKMESICEQLDIQIINIVDYPKSYFVRYSLSFQETYAYLDFYFNAKGQLTYGSPFAILNCDNAHLQQLINLFNE